MTNKHENIMHELADKLTQFFEGSGAVNYIEQTFESKTNPEKSFVLTMQMREGLSPCEKLAKAEERIKELEELLSNNSPNDQKSCWNCGYEVAFDEDVCSNCLVDLDYEQEG